MKFEFSAGGIVFKKENDQIFVLMVQHGGYNHHWSFPKGHIGDEIEGESTEEAALREVKEETGVDAQILDSVSPIHFWYTYKREKRKKTVYFFVMLFKNGDFANTDRSMQKVEWVSLDLVRDKLTFDGDKSAYDEAKEKIIKYANL